METIDALSAVSDSYIKSEKIVSDYEFFRVSEAVKRKHFLSFVKSTDLSG
jgi:hypothetical protein